MLYSSHEELIVVEHFKLINKLGLSALAFAIAALSFPMPIALAAFSCLFVLTFQNGKEYRKISDRYLREYKGIFGFIMLLGKMPIFIFGMTVLWMIVIGEITLPIISEWPKNIPL